jgi:3-oxoacyl-[acyl-carrier protein] reductase
MLAGIEANMIAPVLLIQAVLDGMVERRFGRIVNITSGSVKMPIPGLDLSSGARAGLTGFVAGIARQVAHANVTINNLLPGLFDTDRIAALFDDRAKENRRQAIPAKRFGDPEEFGAACAFLCSAGAGYITGQSLLIDGGAFPGIM